jgi:hypothetical protein
LIVKTTLQVRKRKVKAPEPPALDVNPLGAACDKMKFEHMILGAAEACEKIEAHKAHREAEREAEKLKMDRLLRDVATACDSLDRGRAGNDLIHNVFLSVMNNPL